MYYLDYMLRELQYKVRILISNYPKEPPAPEDPEAIKMKLINRIKVEGYYEYLFKTNINYPLLELN